MKYYDDDYDSSSFEKFTHRKTKKKRKGHQSRSLNSNKRRWMELEESEEYIGAEVVTTTLYEPVNQTSAPTIKTGSSPSTSVGHQFGERTHEIKGIKIDFDGVSDIQKTENIKDGKTTFGIKFLFKGKKGLYRIVWYGTNFRARDASFNNEYAYWLSIKDK